MSWCSLQQYSIPVKLSPCSCVVVMSDGLSPRTDEQVCLPQCNCLEKKVSRSIFAPTLWKINRSCQLTARFSEFLLINRSLN